ncbi:hypothetical protein PaeBR_12980 [Paenibacillus sp. BR2-3]|uniref:hypothetical protein n=1 Tax=Paenibacillus sp. BR2-3 TaxID=3048494 RepID=UPI003977691E
MKKQGMVIPHEHGGWAMISGADSIVQLFTFYGQRIFCEIGIPGKKESKLGQVCAIYHLFLLLLPFVVGQPWMVVAFVFSAGRTFVYAGKVMRPWKVGIIEIVGAVQFLLLSIMVIH